MPTISPNVKNQLKNTDFGFTDAVPNPHLTIDDFNKVKNQQDANNSLMYFKDDSSLARNSLKIFKNSI